jgi:predicted MPP superfamily phosphohydrolase
MVVKIDDAVYLAGRNDAHSRNRKPVADLLRDTPGDLPVILLDHRPTDLENVSRTGADIQLSGHTHYGQLFPINWITNREYELSWGHLKKKRTHVFVTSGIQLWGPPVRTAGFSEILLLHVLFKEPGVGNQIP